MKEFQSVFRNELEEYLKINQGTVNEDTLRNTRRVLLSFDSSLAEENTNVISEAAVNRMDQRNPPDKRSQNGQRQGKLSP